MTISQGAATGLDDVLAAELAAEAVYLQLSAVDIARLSATKRSLRCSLINHLKRGDRHVARRLLQREVLLASTAQLNQQEHHVRAVRFLLQITKMPPVLLQHDANCIVRTPRVPMAVVELLIAAGVRITYQQLAAAAKDVIEGCENWALAQCRVCGQLDGLSMSLKLLETVCDGSRIDDEMLQGISFETYHELLHITLNGFSKQQLFTFRCLILCTQRPDQPLPSSDNNDKALTPAAAAIADLIKSAVQLFVDRSTKDFGRTEYLMDEYMGRFACIPTATSLTAPEVLSILRIVMHTLNHPAVAPRIVSTCMMHICYLAARASPISATDVYQLMQAAMREIADDHKLGLCIAELAELPAAKHINEVELECVLQGIVDSKASFTCAGIRRLMLVPSAELLTPHAISNVLHILTGQLADCTENPVAVKWCLDRVVHLLQQNNVTCSS